MYIFDDDSIQIGEHHNMLNGLKECKEGKIIIPLDLFNNLNSKTKRQTHLDIWLRQLLSIRGISIEKALLISQKYPSLLDLIDGLDSCNSKDEQIKLLTGLSEGGVRVIGKALASKIISVFVE